MIKLKISTIAALAIMVLLAACSTKKAEQGEKMEMATTERSVSEVKIFDGVDPSVKDEIKNLLTDYFQMTKSLVGDNADEARAAARIISETLTKLDMSKLSPEQMSFYLQQKDNLSAALKRLQESVDLDEMRTELSAVSDGMYALVKAYDPNSGVIYYNYCPMAENNKGAYWLSEIKEIENPYMGQAMPHCGSTKEVLQ